MDPKLADEGDIIIPADEAFEKSCSSSSTADRREVVGEQAGDAASVISELS